MTCRRGGPPCWSSRRRRHRPPRRCTASSAAGDGRDYVPTVPFDRLENATVGTSEHPPGVPITDHCVCTVPPTRAGLHGIATGTLAAPPAIGAGTVMKNGVIEHGPQGIGATTPLRLNIAPVAPAAAPLSVNTND